MAAVSQKCFAHLSPVFALSWGLRASRSDKTQVLLGLAAGIHTGMAVIDLFYAGMLLPRVFPPPPSPLAASSGAFFSEPSISIGLLWPISVEVTKWHGKRMGVFLLPLTGVADSLCLVTSPDSYL